MARLDTAVNTDIPLAGRAFLDEIAAAEGADYNTLFGGRRIEDLSKHPGIDVPITRGPNKGKTSSAFGRYQFTEPTWNDQAKKLGLTHMGPKNQDLAAWDLAQTKYNANTGRNLLDDLNTGDPKLYHGALRSLSKIWTSMPGGIEQSSRYGRRPVQEDLGPQEEIGRFDPTQIPLSDLFMSGMGRGWENLKSDVTDVIPSMAGEALGFHDYAKEQLAEREEKLKEAQAQYPSFFPDFKSVEDIPSGLGYAAEKIGEQVPNIASVVVPGAAARLGATRAAGLLGRELSAESLSRIHTAGMGAGAAALNIPETYEQIHNETGELHPGIATMFGAVKSGLDTMFAGRISRQLGEGALSQLAAKAVENSSVAPSLKRIFLKEAAKDMALEGTTEGTQEFIDQLASQAAGSKHDLFSKEHLDNILESALVGSITGTAFGAPSSLAKAQQIKEAQQAELDKQAVGQQITGGINESISSDGVPVGAGNEVLTDELLKGTGLKPRSVFFKDLLGKDLSNEADLKEIRDTILPKIKRNQYVEGDTKSKLEALVKGERPAGPVEVEGTPRPEQGAYPVGAFTAPSRESLGLPSGQQPSVSPTGAGVPEAGGVASAAQVSTGPAGGAEAQPSALGDYGYHAGDLGYGHDTTLGRMSGGRGTGHFGTGVYFVGDRSRIGSREDRPVHQVDFSEYNLAKPSNDVAARDLHDGLRDINRLVEHVKDGVLQPSEKVNDLLRSASFKLKYSVFPKKDGRHVSQDEIKDSIIKHVEERAPVSDKVFATSTYEDTAATKVMKDLGFEGVDVRHVPQFDTGDYGSVIYRKSLKPEVTSAAQAPDVGKLPLPMQHFAKLTNAKDLLDTYTKHGKDEGLKSLASLLSESPHAKSVGIKFVKQGDQLPTNVVKRFNNGAGAIAHATSEGSTLYFREDDPNFFGEDVLNHEVIHGLTEASLQRNPKIKNNLMDLSGVISRALKDAASKSGSPAKAKELADFWSNYIAYKPGELLAYGLTSPTFREVLSGYAADGKPFSASRMPHEQDAIRKGPRPGYAPEAPKGPNLFQRFMDFMRRLFGIPEKNKLAFRKAMDEFHANSADYERRVADYNTMRPLADRLDRSLKELLGTTAEHGVVLPTKDEVASSVAATMPSEFSVDFSLPNAPFQVAKGIDSFTAKIPVFGEPAAKHISRALDGAEKGIRSAFLGFLPTNALSETAAPHFPAGLTQQYHNAIGEHDGYIHKMAEKAIEVPMSKYRKAMKANRKQQALYDYINTEATKYGVDPDDAQSVLNADKFSMGYIVSNPDGSEKDVEIKYFKTAAERKAAIAAYNDGKSKEEHAFVVRDPDVGVRIKAQELKNKFDSLDDSWKDLYRTIRNVNAGILREYKNSLGDRIDEAQNVDESARISLKKGLYRRLAEAGMIHPYFSLGREGDYWLAAEVPNQHGAYESFVTALQDPLSRKKMEANLKNRVYQHEVKKNMERGMEAKAAHDAAYKTAIQRVRVYDNIQDIDYRRVPPGSVINDILGIIEKKKPARKEGESDDAYRVRTQNYEAMEKEIMQMVINSLPETSFLKSLQKRGNVSGHIGEDVTGTAKDVGDKRDTVGVFERKTRSSIRQIANLRFRPKLGAILDAMRSHADTLGRGQEEVRDPDTGELVQEEMLPQDNTIQAQYLKEFNKHADNVFNPSQRKAASFIKTLLYGGTLGFNVSSGLIATSNLPMVTLPYLKSEYGMKASWDAMGKAALIIKESGFARKLRAFGSEEDTDVAEETMKSGPSFGNYGPDKAINPKYGLSMDDLAVLKDIATSRGQLNRSQLYENLLSSARTTPLDKFNAMSGWMLHTAEKFNREVTLLSAYMLELNRLKGLGVPIQDARIQAANKSVYDTEKVNGSVASASTPSFAQSDIGSVVYMYKRFGVTQYYLQYKTLIDALKAEKDSKVRKMLIDRFWSLTGATALMSGLHGIPMFGIAAMMYNLFQDDDDDDFDTVARKGLGEFFYNGPVDYITGLSIASRVGINGSIIKEPIGSGESHGMVSTLVDMVGGPFPSMVDRFERGVDMIANGHVARGIENLVPVAAANVMKSARYAMEGAKSLRGDTVYDDIGPGHILAQALGFTPAEVARRQEFGAKQKGISKAITTKESQIKGRHYLAFRERDAEGMNKAKEDLLKLGTKHPDLDYRPSNVNRKLYESIKAHESHTKKMFMAKEYPKKQMKEVMKSAKDLDLIP